MSTGLAVLLLIQLCANVPGKAGENDPSTWSLPVRETWVKLLTLTCLALGCRGHLGNEPGYELSLSLSSSTVFLSVKYMLYNLKIG